MNHNYFLVFSFLCILKVLQADVDLCIQLKPCGQRGSCVGSSNEASKNLLTIKCFCRYNYTGQWCQFVGDKYFRGQKDKVPGKPKILTDTRVPNYNQKYQLKFKGVEDPGIVGKVLYYLLRYTDVTTSQGEWRSEAVTVKNKGGIHYVILDKLDWGHRYKLQLYAGNRYGLGEPDRGTVTRPKVSIPKIVDVSEDRTGRRALCCGKPLKLYCKAKGTPAPTYSWHFKGKRLNSAPGVVLKGGILTVRNPYVRHTNFNGEYRCVASNAWGSVLSSPVQVKVLASGKPDKRSKSKGSSYSLSSLPNLFLYRKTNLTMNCGQRKGLVTWYYNGKELMNPRSRKGGIGRGPIHGHTVDIQYKLKGSRLQLINPETIATGIYQCEVEVKDGIVCMTRYVHFRNFHRIEALRLTHKASDEVRLEEGSTATLTCLPTPPVILPVNWKNLSRKTEERSRKLPNGSLEIRNISQSESNTRITCKFSRDQDVSAKRSLGIYVARSVDGGWSSWGSWEKCRGLQCDRDIRFRKCDNPAPRYDGRYCSGPEAQKIGVWSGWSAWLCIPKSGKCGKHVKVRSRTCPMNGVCPGPEKQKKRCSLFIPCPVNGFWSQWSPWSACTKTCYPGGTQSRVRRCKPPKHGGKTCSGNNKMTRNCHTDSGPCPINGAWTSWSSWTECSTSCDSGRQLRIRNCANPKPKHGGKDCLGNNTIAKKCMIKPCIVNGGWSAWSDFSACSVSCGAGVKYSTRICNNPRAENGGKECEGNSQYRTQCDMTPCKVNGSWSSWSSWSECSKSCDSGFRSRVRNCTNPEPKHGGRDCEGENKIEKTCHMTPCRVNGGWSAWSKWSSCSVTCDSGVKTRIRSCTHPKPRHGGKKCHGKHEFQAKCHHKSCKAMKSENLPDVKLAKKNLRSNNNNAIIYTALAGVGVLLLVGILLCCYRVWHVRSRTKDYMPLSNVKTKPVEPKSILKSTPTKRTSTASDTSELLPGKRSSNIKSKTSDVRSKSAKRGSLPPPPPPPLPDRSTSRQSARKKRHTGGKHRQSTNSKEDPSRYDGVDKLDKTTLEPSKAAIQNKKLKDMATENAAKDLTSTNVLNNRSVSSSTPKGPTSRDDVSGGLRASSSTPDGPTSRDYVSGGLRVSSSTPKGPTSRDDVSDGLRVSSSTPKGPTSRDDGLRVGPTTGSDNSLKEVVLESDKNASPHNTSSSAITKEPSTGDKSGLPNLGNAKDNDGPNIVKQDSSSLFVPRRPSEPPVVPSGSSAEPSKSGKITESESIYGGLIGFENAILETGDKEVKKAMIQRVKSKSNQKKSSI